MDSDSDSDNLYQLSDTRVFWDVEDFPVPEDRELKMFYDKVERALKMEGYDGELSIYAYGLEKTPQERVEFHEAEIWFVPETGEKSARLNQILLDMIDFARRHPNYQKKNLLLALKDIPEETTELVSVMQGLIKKGYEVFLAVPDDLPESDLPPSTTATLVWRWKSLFDGDVPLDAGSDSDEDEGSSQKIN
uniref:NYN domain-containing protein n=1 Tax=Noccaea caerulescens TaxID=107243 RepID=A0A1J3K2M4_NOCCA